MMAEDLGFEPSNVLTMQVFLSPAHYPSTQSVLNFYNGVLDRVAAFTWRGICERGEFPAAHGLEGLLQF